MKHFATLLLAAAAVLALPAVAQEISFTNSQPLTLPADTFFGMAAGVATDSKGHVFVYTRNGEPTVTLASSRSCVWIWRCRMRAAEVRSQRWRAAGPSLTCPPWLSSAVRYCATS